MKTKKCLTVFFFAVDPGAFNIMQPIFRLAPDSAVCHWVAEGYAKDVLISRKVKNLSVDDVLSKDSRSMGGNEILIIGSQMNTDRTTDILSQSKGICLKTMFIFDHWSNYHKHFKLSQGGYVFPDKVLVMDEFCGEKVKSTGIAESSIVISGHPSIENTVAIVDGIDIEEREKLRNQMGAETMTKVVLLALEPLSDVNSIGTIGFDEYSVAKITIDSLAKINDPNICLVIRLHPRQNKNRFIESLNNYGLKDKLNICPNEVSFEQSLAASDVVLGMTSILLVHARAIGKPALSLQFNRTSLGESRSFQHIEEIVVTKPAEFKSSLIKKLHTKKEPPLCLVQNSTDRVWEEILGY